MTNVTPLIIGIGGTLRPESSSERALRLTLDAVEARGGRAVMFAGQDLDAPAYDFGAPLTPKMHALIEALRVADGVVLASPCYHGGISGLIKNALDYTEEMNRDVRPYLHGLVVGCIATGAGHQGPGMVLSSLRNIVHALRGWPCPLGVGINTAEVNFTSNGCSDPRVGSRLTALADQVCDFIRLPQLGRERTPQTLAMSA
ncbi:hypothetical protein ADU59_21585 [Pararhizobium polonicum]|uniref:NADPH-dependent FMN reductase-like domain-containing protein n=1 Tax=Pararhizobium polonicum TaxID=1612624 RepID=A0A1C7NWR2_9HYPH|nr:NADPH-dependent FMN reductase [Pararhizobium polonicum]OBZ93448.1 hypothetical protein ADU59_21585 [Pararhizobium polonicum]